MATQLQLRRGTTAENDAFTGAVGEVTMGTEKKQLRVHDGVTQGGAGIVDPVVDFQVPTAQNNYTWYRKYSSGWVEQGGIVQPTSAIVQNHSTTLPVPMADANYTLELTVVTDSLSSSPTYYSLGARTISTTAFTCYMASTFSRRWYVAGMAA